MRPSPATLAIGGLAVASALAATIPALAPARVVSGPLLAMILPGLAILRMRPFAGGQGLGALALGVPLSLAVAALAGLLLNLVGALDARGWAISLCAVTLAACLLRRAEPKGSPGWTFPMAQRPVEAAAFLVAAVLMVAGVAVAREGAQAQRQFAYTEFWMIPRAPADQDIVKIGVKNEQRETTSYRVAIVSDGATIGRWPSVSLAPGETWTADIALNSKLRRSRVEAWLYRTQHPEIVYRKAWIAALPAKVRTD